MVLPQASNLNTDNANQMLMQMAQQSRTDQLRKQQLQIEDEKRKFEVMSQINPAALSDKFDSEIVNQSLGGLVSNVKEYYKTNPNSFELQSFVQGEMTKIATWNSKVKSVRQRVDEGMKQFNMKGFTKSSVYAKAIDSALYKTVNGQKVMKDPDEISVDEDYISSAVQNNASSLLNRQETYDILDGAIKDAHLNPITEERVVKGQDGLVRSTNRQKVSYPSFMEWDDQKGEADIRGVALKDNKGNVIKDAKGRPMRYIAEDIFAKHEADPALNQLMTEEASKVLAQKKMDPSDSHNMELAKRAWLTSYYEDRAGVKKSEENSKQNVTVHNYGNQTPQDQKPVHPSTRIDAIVKGTEGWRGQEITVDEKTGSDVTEQFAGLPMGKDLLGAAQYPSVVLFKDGKFTYKIGNKWTENQPANVFKDRIVTNSNIPEISPKIDPKTYNTDPGKQPKQESTKKKIEGF